MTRAATNIFVRSVGLFAAIGCASSHPAPTPAPPATTSGAEPAAAQMETPAPAPEPAPMPEAAGPATITVAANVHGKPVAATVRVLGTDGHEVQKGRAGEPLHVQSGDYEMRVEITDPAALLDKPTQHRPLTLHPGDDVHEAVDFPWAMIQLNVMVNGHAEKNATVRLIRQGNEVATLKSGASPVTLSPGRYEAEVKTHGATIQVQGLMFPEGATQSMPVNVQF